MRPKLAPADLARLVHGAKRAELVESLNETLRVRRGHPESHDALDGRIAELLGLDPSLALERARASNYRSGTILDDLVYLNLAKSVGMVLDAGIHPDDARAFQVLDDGQVRGGRRLLCLRHSTTSQRLPVAAMVRLALAHGATPDPDHEGFLKGTSNSLVRRYAIDLFSTAPMDAAVTRDRLDAIVALLRGGAQGIDPMVNGSNKEWDGFLMLLSIFKPLDSATTSLDSEAARWYREVAAVAMEHGAKLDYRTDNEPGIPLALRMARMGWVVPAAVLVELGAADVWGQVPQGLIDEHFGVHRGLYTEAVMRRRIACVEVEPGPAAMPAPVAVGGTGTSGRSARRRAQL